MHGIFLYIYPLVSLVFGLQPTPARDPSADVQQFVSEFEAEYGTQHPRFLTCGYDQVRLLVWPTH